ncbi:hypothetical protein OOK13_18305 [Streptomyces sp. NBC_00378]|uniref:hypothetical protein n=1 Tax=unclassified Streptomyces TaxID=2593676 RepID=UPI002253533D|nr:MULTISPECIES: hypothetical protein [unclassified Streptomyces]MCX5110469.1 hypothetical protein [Streptomyces sp. NBC_00378]
MHHPSHTPTGPADLALPLALVSEQATHGTDRAPEVGTTAARKRRAARRRAAAVRG